MTYSTIASIVKYPYASSAASKKGKFGFFQSEQDTYCRLADEMGIFCKSAPGEPLRYARHPLVYLVEAADDICYEIMDLEDAHKLKILSFETVSRLFLDFFGCPKPQMGYVPFIADTPDGPYKMSRELFSFPYGFKHGTVLEITEEEYDRMKAHDWTNIPDGRWRR